MRVNAVAPGLVDTEMWEPTFERLGEDAVRDGFAKRVPLARWGTADEIAHAVLYLGSDEGVEVLVLQGRPLGEPVARYGPFVMTTKVGGPIVACVM